MATLTSTSAAVLDTASNIREDLGNVIYNVDPVITPFTSNIPKTAATNDNHEWLTDSFQASVATNLVVEAQTSDTVGVNDGTTRTRKGNQIGIAQKTVVVTKKAEMLDRAGVPGREMARQLMMRGKEIQMDQETQLLQVSATTCSKVAAGASTAGRPASVASWIVSAESFGTSGGNDASGNSDGTGNIAAGSNRAISNTIIDGVLDTVWEGSGTFGNNNVMMADAATVGFIKNLNGIADSVDSNAATGEIHARVTVYVSQFGPVRVVPNKHMGAESIFVLDYNTWGLAFAGGKKIHTTDIATQTSAEQKLLESYYTLEARSEEANGAIYDITS